jgi:uncharacterized protein YkwD
MRVPTSLLGLFAASLLVSALGGIRLAPARAEGSCVASYSAAPAAEEQAAVDAINALRAGNGLAPLAVSSTLTRAAAEKSAGMAAGAPFAHDDPYRTWQQRLADCGFDTRVYVSENIAAGTETGVETVRMWQNSPGHLANMLYADVRSVGIARARGGAYGWYWTADFSVAEGD